MERAKLLDGAQYETGQHISTGSPSTLQSSTGGSRGSEGCYVFCSFRTVNLTTQPSAELGYYHIMLSIVYLRSLRSRY